jgi:hypothetical protein
MVVTVQPQGMSRLCLHNSWQFFRWPKSQNDPIVAFCFVLRDDCPVLCLVSPRVDPPLPLRIQNAPHKDRDQNYWLNVDFRSCGAYLYEPEKIGGSLFIAITNVTVFDMTGLARVLISWAAAV